MFNIWKKLPPEFWDAKQVDLMDEIIDLRWNLKLAVGVLLVIFFALSVNSLYQ